MVEPPLPIAKIPRSKSVDVRDRDCDSSRNRPDFDSGFQNDYTNKDLFADNDQGGARQPGRRVPAQRGHAKAKDKDRPGVTKSQSSPGLAQRARSGDPVQTPSGELPTRNLYTWKPDATQQSQAAPPPAERSASAFGGHQVPDHKDRQFEQPRRGDRRADARSDRPGPIQLGKKEQPKQPAQGQHPDIRKREERSVSFCEQQPPHGPAVPGPIVTEWEFH